MCLFYEISPLPFQQTSCIIGKVICRCVGIGRRGGLKIHCQRWRAGSSPATGTTSEQSPLCFDAFLCNGHKKASFARFLAPPFQNRSRSLRLFACKRALDASRSLPTCFGYGSLIPAGGIFQISFFNEIRLLVSEILLRNMKYAMRMKYLLRKGSSSYCKLTKIFLL